MYICIDPGYLDTLTSYYHMIITIRLEFIETEIEIKTIRMKILELKIGIGKKQICENTEIELKTQNSSQPCIEPNVYF